MGITINCARCHDHKLDPISQKEYYQLQSVFAGVKRGDRTIPFPEKKTLIKQLAEVRRSLFQIQVALDLADIVGGGNGKGTGTRGKGIDPRNGKPESAPMGYLNNVVPNRYVKSPNPFVDGVQQPVHLEIRQGTLVFK